MIVLFLCLISSYLIGSIMSALVIAKLFKLPDPRTLGSGNPGASNMSRVHSKNLGSLTLLGDVYKGFMPLYISSWIIADPTQLCLIALATFLGHLFPCFHKFKGGKGIATMFGIIIFFSFYLGLLVAAIWLIAFLLSRIASIASISSLLICPIAFTLAHYQPEIIYLMLTLCFLALLKHQTNIKQLIKGKEYSFRANDSDKKS